MVAVTSVQAWVAAGVAGMPLLRNARVRILAYGSRMLGAPISKREVMMSSEGGVAGSTGSPLKVIPPAVTRVAAVMEPMSPRITIALVLVEFAPTAQSGASRKDKSPNTTPAPVVARARMQRLSSALTTATASVEIV